MTAYDAEAVDERIRLVSSSLALIAKRAASSPLLVADLERVADLLRSPLPAAAADGSCRGCGEPLPNEHRPGAPRRYCSTCRPTRVRTRVVNQLPEAS